MLYAHTDSLGGLENGQPLVEHLVNVAESARRFASPMAAGEWAYWAGMLHDVGKATAAFQRRLSGSHESVNHTDAGAQLAASLGDVGKAIAFPILGHHGGMPNWSDPEGSTRTVAKERLARPVELLLDEFSSTFFLPKQSALLSQDARPKCLKARARDAKEAAFGLYLLEQMMFSSLVDADYLDTERVMAPEEAEKMGPAARNDG